MSDSLNLYRLQQLDTRLAQIELRQKSISESLESNAQLQEAKSNLEFISKKRQSITSELKHKENDAADKKIKIEQIESSLYGGTVQNPKELQGLQTELDSLKRNLVSLEDQELQDMIALDTIQGEYKIMSEKYNEILNRVAQENKHLVVEQGILQKEAERLTVERHATTQSIDGKYLSLYDEIREQRHGIAVTTISDNSCDSCGAVLTPAQQQSAHHSHQLFRCPSCGRFIYS
jgi:predicted  nucleic acid-binding Zn-ribbon protein